MNFQFKSLTSWQDLWKSSVVPGAGASSTKIVYILTGRYGTWSAVFMTVGFVTHAFVFEKADSIFALALGAMWAAVLGFPTNAQNTKAKADAGTPSVSVPPSTPAANKEVDT